MVGRLVAWMRRNLTSHLKEPYLDPIILRQQAYNLRSTWTINELTRRIAQLSQQTRLVPGLQAQVAQSRHT